MTMGPPQAADALREALELGADRAIHLNDRPFAVADTLGTSRTLAMALEKEGGVDLVVCGRKALDAETWQVPPEVAAFLGIPHLTSVVALERPRREARRRPRVGRGRGRVRARPARARLGRALLGRAAHGLRRGRRSPSGARTTSSTTSGRTTSGSARPARRRACSPSATSRPSAPASSPPRREDAAARIAALLAERAKPPSPWEKPERLGEVPGRGLRLLERRRGARRGSGAGRARAAREGPRARGQARRPERRARRRPRRRGRDASTRSATAPSAS